MEERITITLKLFAAYREAVGVEEMEMVVPVGMTAGGVCDRLIAEYPELLRWKALTRFGINLQFVEAEEPLRAGDELVLIPPVSGG